MKIEYLGSPCLVSGYNLFLVVASGMSVGEKVDCTTLGYRHSLLPKLNLQG